MNDDFVRHTSAFICHIIIRIIVFDPPKRMRDQEYRLKFLFYELSPKFSLKNRVDRWNIDSRKILAMSNCHFYESNTYNVFTLKSSIS